MRKVLAGWGLTALLIVPIGGAAQDQSGWEQFGRALGEGSEDAYLQGLREGLERDALLHEVRTRRYVEWVRSQLSGLWQVAGFSTSDATALAAAYEPAASEAAVLAGVRRKGTQAATLDIRAALDANNYLLANQLLLAFTVVTVEEQKTAARKETERRQSQRQTEPEASPLTPEQPRELRPD